MRRTPEADNKKKSEKRNTKRLTSQELFPRLGLVSETAEHRARHGRRSRFLDTSHGHTEVTLSNEESKKGKGENIREVISGIGSTTRQDRKERKA